jgi:predicted RNase H-like HicB family nuclease
MEIRRLEIALTAVYLRSGEGYIGFVEELPGLNSFGHSIVEARSMLFELARVVFDEERRGSEELIANFEVVRESFSLPIPRR